MWSTMRNPGCRKSDAEMIRCTEGSAAPRINLFVIPQPNPKDNVQVHRPQKDETQH